MQLSCDHNASSVYAICIWKRWREIYIYKITRACDTRILWKPRLPENHTGQGNFQFPYTCKHAVLPQFLWSSNRPESALGGTVPKGDWVVGVFCFQGMLPSNGTVEKSATRWSTWGATSEETETRLMSQVKFRNKRTTNPKFKFSTLHLFFLSWKVIYEIKIDTDTMSARAVLCEHMLTTAARL